MFQSCTLLKYLDLSNFNTSKVNNMENMFYQCISLISLNLSNFDTKSTTNMASMFRDCISLKSLYLDNFNTTLVTNMNGMFLNCSSLVSLDLNNFNLTKNEDSGSMFKYCKSLKTLNLSNFKNVLLTNMSEMFSECESLLSLDISGLNIFLVSDMNNLFYNCKSLISLNLKNFDNLILIPSDNMFKNCNKSLRYCVNKSNILENINTQLNDFQNNNCSDACFVNSINKFIIEKTQYIDNCSNDDYYTYEYNGVCYHSCPSKTHKSIYNDYLCEETICDNYYNYDLTDCLDNIPIGYFLNDSSLRTIDKCNIKCLNCSLESNEIDLCVSCNINESYYPKYNDNSNKNSFFNCYNGSIENYYLNDKNGIYMPCYSLCKTCHWQGDKNQNNCSECYDNYALSEDGNCQEISINRDIDYYIKLFLHSINISNYSSYYYEINLKENDTETKNKYSDFTFIDFPPNSKNSLINNFFWNFFSKHPKTKLIIV